jgi:hypothetical protein
MRKNIELE